MHGTKKSDIPYSDEDLENQPSSSEALPPFSESAVEGHTTVDWRVARVEGVPTSDDTPETQEPPPFTPYEAEFFTDHSGNVVSHDPHLNEDGEALYRFLLTQANERPNVSVHLSGSHPENRSRLITKQENGRSVTRTEYYTEQVADFSFSISMQQNLIFGPYQFSVGDVRPAYRGGMVKEVENNIEGFSTRRKADKQECKADKKWREYRVLNGFAPWVAPPDHFSQNPSSSSTAVTEQWVTPEGESWVPDDAHTLKSSKSLRDWADEYCASDKVLKEFVYEKVPYGWSLTALQAAINELIASTHYSGKVKISFPKSSTHIFIRPSTRFSRMLSNRFVVVLLWIFLIYPFIWLFKRFHSSGGGRWEVSGSAYAYKRFVKIAPGDTLPVAPRSRSGVVRDFGNGPVRVLGIREGEWFQLWERTIRESVVNRLQSVDVLMQPHAELQSRYDLDGYEPNHRTFHHHPECNL